MEASALQAPAGLTRSRISLGASLLRLRSDEQLVALFRSGHDEAFRAIYDRYHQRLFAYTRQMLPGSRQDAEDALQDVFVRAYSGLRANARDLALRAWLYRVAHNRCIDELRRPAPPAPELIELVSSPVQDPIAEAERRESLQRLVSDVRRLPEQQRSALLMRELGGMTYIELAGALGVSVPAVKSLLVRARVSLAAAAVARDTACSEIRAELVAAHDRRVRPNAVARRHLRDCAGCCEFRTDMRGVSRQFAALVPALGPVALIWNSVGVGGGGGAAAGGAVAGTGGAFAASGLISTGISHVATLIAAAVVTTGGAIELQNSLSGPTNSVAHHRTYVRPATAGRHAGPASQSESVATTSGTPAAAPTPAAGGVGSSVSMPASSPGSAAPEHSIIQRVAAPPASDVPPLAIQNGAAAAAAAAAALDPAPATPPTGAQTSGSSAATTSPSNDSSGTSTQTGATSQTTPSGATSSSGSSTTHGGTSSATGTTSGPTGTPSTSAGDGSAKSSGGPATTPSSGGTTASGQ